MISRLKSRIKNNWDTWVKRRHSPGNPQIVNTRNLYILPTGFGWAYGIVVFLLLIGAVNYQINMIFLMTFMLAIIGMVSACEAHGNILNLSYKLIEVEDAEEGAPAKIVLRIAANEKIRFGVGCRVGKESEIRLEKIPVEGLTFIVSLETQSRGFFHLPPIITTSVYPFGIFRVWSYAYFDEDYYVYPKPVNPGFWPEPNRDRHGESKILTGDDELYDLKQVEDPWSEPKLIAWKIAARGLGWYLKKTHSYSDNYWLFSLNDSPSVDVETKLKHLSYWLQSAEANGLIYGLELTESATKFGRGKEHLQHCLRQLALYP